MSDTTYRQVHIRHHYPDQTGATTETVCWIPEKFAKLGKVIEVKVNDSWVEYEVMWVGVTAFKGSFVEARERDYRKQRSVSDV